MSPLARTAMRWDDEGSNYMKALARDRVPTKIIALVLNRRPDGIRAQAKKLNIGLPGTQDHVLPFLKQGNHLIKAQSHDVVWANKEKDRIFHAPTCEALAKFGVIVKVEGSDKTWKIKR
jgi:hypothetical protein